MSPPSRPLPEVSGFTISFIGGSEGGRAGRGWNLNGWFHTTASRWSEVSILWNGVKWSGMCCAVRPGKKKNGPVPTASSPDTDTCSLSPPPSFTYKLGREPDLLTGG